MGSMFGDISMEAVVTVAIVAGAAAFATVQLTSSGAAPSQGAGTPAEASKSSKKKTKAKAKGKDDPKTISDSSEKEPKAAPVAVEAIPGDFDAPKVDLAAASVAATPPAKKKSKGKKKKGAADSQNLSASEASIPPELPTKGATPKAPTPAVTVTAAPEPVRAPLSAAPPPRIETPDSGADASESDDASLAGRATPTRSTTSESSTQPIPAAGFSWGDYEDAHDVNDDDEGWGVVTSRRGARNPSIIPATANKPATSASQALTKRQRQNAAKREAEKSMKAIAEKERLAQLAKHKRDLEKTRMAEQAASAGKSKVSGGMKASVDNNGKLVWE